MNMLILASFAAIFSPIIFLIKNKKIKKILIYTFFILVISAIGFRSIKTPDTKNYEYMFYNIYSNEIIIQRLETLYKIFIKINLQIFKNFRIYLIFITFSFFLFWKKITKYFVNEISIIFGTFYLTYGVYYFGITQRQALAFLIAYAGLKQIIIDKKNVMGVIMITLSSFFHSSMLLYLLVVFLCRKTFKNFYLEILIFISFIFSFFSAKNLVLMHSLEILLDSFKLNHYKAYLTPNLGISINTIYYTILAFFFLKYRSKIKLKKEIYNFFLNLYIVGVLVLNFLSFFKGVSRLADIFLIFMPIILGNIFFNLKKKENKILMILVIIFNNALLFMISLKNLFIFYIN